MLILHEINCKFIPSNSSLMYQMLSNNFLVARRILREKLISICSISTYSDIFMILIPFTKHKPSKRKKEKTFKLEKVFYVTVSRR